jgi:hypothetical protein
LSTDFSSLDEGFSTLESSSPLMDWILRAVYEDYLVPIVVTSQTQGKIPSLGLPFGQGKSTFALWLSYMAYREVMKDKVDVNSVEGVREVWRVVFENLFLLPEELDKYVFRHPEFRKPSVTVDGRIPLVVWDDMQETVGKRRRFDRYLNELADRLTKGREKVAVIVGTCPHLAMLMRPFREFFNIEVLIPQRGRFEVQKMHYVRRFDRWDDHQVRAWYQSESGFYTPTLPPDIQKAYDEWKEKEQAKLDARRWRLKALEEEEEELKHARIVQRIVSMKEEEIEQTPIFKQPPKPKVPPDPDDEWGVDIDKKIQELKKPKRVVRRYRKPVEDVEDILRQQEEALG